MQFQEQKITTGKYLYRFAKFLLTPGMIGRVKSLLTTRPEDKMSMVGYFEQHAADRPDAAAVLYEDRRISWGELNAAANQMAGYFRERGIGYGDRIAVNLENRPELPIVVAAQKLGAIAGMVNTGQTHEALAHSLKLIDPQLIVVGAECLANMDTIRDELEAAHKGKFLFVADGDAAAAPAGHLDLMAQLDGRDSANIVPDKQLTLGTPTYYIFTSGTTGLPKASVTTHLKLFRASTQFGANMMSMKPDDVYYCALPLYHSGALIVGYACAVRCGATFALRRKFSASGFGRTASASRPRRPSTSANCCAICWRSPSATQIARIR